MSYNYVTQRYEIFREENQLAFLKVRDKARELLHIAGAASCECLLAGCGVADSWTGLAFVDRLVELGELIEIPNQVSRAGQHRIFIAPFKP